MSTRHMHGIAWEEPFGYPINPTETTQALDEFQAAILFLKQREPKHHSLISFEKAREQERDCARKRECQL